MASEDPVLYDDNILIAPTLYGIAANDVGAILGISSNLILGAITEEYNDRNESLWDQFTQAGTDLYLETFGSLSHEDFLRGYEYAAQQGANWRNDAKKFLNPVLFDVGVGNVQIYTAIRLLNDYATSYPNSDPLDIKAYLTNYAALAEDLLKPYSNVTTKFAGLMVSEGLSWGSQNISNWNNLSIVEREAFAIFYYNLGPDKMNLRLAEALATEGVYVVDIDATLIAQEYLMNLMAIQQAASGSSHWDFVREQIASGELNQCFLAGTQILMDNHSPKPIESIAPGDVVLSYDAAGTLVPGRVTRTFRKEVSHLLDVHGLKVTPGHVTLCGDGMFKGRHVPIIDILLSDGALVTAEGGLVRMAINRPVGSVADRMVKVLYALTAEDARAGRLLSGEMRAGTLLFDREGEPVSVLDCLTAEGLSFDPDTGLVVRPGQAPEPLRWFGPLPRPEDHILRRSRETLEAILTDGEWEGAPSELVARRLRHASNLKVN